MRCAIFVTLLAFVSLGRAYAQSSTHSEAHEIKGSSEGTLTCKTEAAMVRLMKTMAPPRYVIDKQVVAVLIKGGDCLIMPDGWQLLEAQDPPLDQQDDHASKWTIRTPQGIVHMWGIPFGGD